VPRAGFGGEHDAGFVSGVFFARIFPGCFLSLSARIRDVADFSKMRFLPFLGYSFASLSSTTT